MPVYKDNRRNTYYYSFSHKGKRIRSADFTNKKDCEKALATALLDADKYATESLTFSQAQKLFLSEKRTRMKQQSYDRLNTMLTHFTCTIGDVRIDRLTPDKYRTALEYLDAYRFNGKPLKNSYKNKIIRTFKQLCAWTGKRYNLHCNVPDMFEDYRNEQKQEMRIITLQQFIALLQHIQDDPYRSLFITLFFMGLRLGECNALQWQDIDFEKNTLTVRHTVSTKVRDANGNYLITDPKTAASLRTLPMPQIVSSALLHLRDNSHAYAEKHGTAFVFGGYTPIPESNIEKRKQKYFQAAGLQPIRIHDFRHSCASFLINNGASALHVSKWLGHANISITLNIYSHLWDNGLQKITDLIDNFQ